MKRAELIVTGDPGAELKRKGFVKIEARQFQTNRVFDEEFAQIQRAAAKLPLDHTEVGSGRSRRYGKMLYLPWQGANVPVPPRHYPHSGEYGLEYSQPLALNSQGGGNRRIFAAITEALYRNRALNALLDLFRSLLPFDPDERGEAMQMGIHMLKLEASQSVLARANPNLVHRDGEPFTVAVLLNRKNARGGENVITSTRWHDHQIDSVPPPERLASFTLTQPLDAYIVQDDRVAHFVAPVGAECGVGVGVRTTLLLDFTPLRPALVMTGVAA